MLLFLGPHYQRACVIAEIRFVLIAVIFYMHELIQF